MDLTAVLALVAIPLQALAMAILLSIVANRLVEGLVKPVFEKKGWDKFGLMYVAWGFGALLTGLGEVNLFKSVFPEFIWGVVPGEVVGIILSALVAGGGANFINDVFSKTKKV